MHIPRVPISLIKSVTQQACSITLREKGYTYYFSISIFISIFEFPWQMMFTMQMLISYFLFFSSFALLLLRGHSNPSIQGCKVQRTYLLPFIESYKREKSALLTGTYLILIDKEKSFMHDPRARDCKEKDCL